MSGYYRVRNFEKFQHYKDRRPSWIKLHAELLDNYDFSHLPDATKFHAVAIWLLASQMDNRIPGDPAWLAKKIGATESVDLQALVDARLLEPCQRTASAKKAPRKQPSMPETERETEERQRQTGAPRKDELFEAIARECGMALDSLTKSARGELNNCRKQLAEANATPAAVRSRAIVYRAMYPNASLTPSALAKHWPSLVPKSGGVATMPDPELAARIAATQKAEADRAAALAAPVPDSEKAKAAAFIARLKGAV